VSTPFWKDRVWLALVVGPLIWIAVFSSWVDWKSLADVCLVLGGSFCINLGIVSICQPWLQRDAKDSN
jgi:hypothetical protein